MSSKAILITSVSVLLVLGGIVVSFISSAAPNIWRRPTAIKNYLLHSGRVTFSFPSDLQIVEGIALDECGEETGRGVAVGEDSILFRGMSYGKYYFHITVKSGTETNCVEFCTWHAPDWSRDRYDITQLEPLEYDAYSNGEHWDTELLRVKPSLR